jgi:hypothetical protein
MAPKSIRVSSAEELQGKKDLVTYLNAFAGGYRRCCIALASRRPPVYVSEGIVKQWMSHYRSPAGAIQVSTADEMEGRYGEKIRGLAAANRTGYRLMKALKTLTPPLYATEKAAGTWLRKYGLHSPTSAVRYATAESLEHGIGAEMRRELAAAVSEALLLKKPPVLADEATCRAWLEQYGNKPAAASGAVLKRPAAAAAASGAVLKRPAAASRKRISPTREESCAVSKKRPEEKEPAASSSVSPTREESSKARYLHGGSASDGAVASDGERAIKPRRRIQLHRQKCARHIWDEVDFKC